MLTGWSWPRGASPYRWAGLDVHPARRSRSVGAAAMGAGDIATDPDAERRQAAADAGAVHGEEDEGQRRDRGWAERDADAPTAVTAPATT